MNTTLFEQKEIVSFSQKGEGIPLVFLHGFCADSSIWEDFIALFPGRNILRIDLPGFGLSEQIENYSIARYAEVIHTVLENLNIQSSILIGHSMGGYIGLEYAKKYSDRLQGLCLFHSHPYADSEEKKKARKKSIKFINNNGPIYYVKQLIPKLFTPTFSNGNHLQLAKLVFKASKYTAENIIAGLEVMHDRADNTEVLSTLNFPVLFIIGKEDTVVPNYLKDTARPNVASIHLLKNIAHMGMLEGPKKCKRIIKDFIDFVSS